MFGKKKRDIIIDERKEREEAARTYPMSDKHRYKVYLRFAFYILLCLSVPIFTSSLLILPFNRSSNVFGVLGFWAFSTLVLMTPLLQRTYHLWRDYTDGIMRSVDTTIQLDIIESVRHGVKYKLQAGDFLFSIEKDEFLRLSQGQFYRIYYSPRSKIYFDADPLF
jgi:hypothetical protein